MSNKECRVYLMSKYYECQKLIVKVKMANKLLQISNNKLAAKSKKLQKRFLKMFAFLILLINLVHS